MKQQGITLIELVVAMAVMALVGMAAVTVLESSVDVYDDAENKVTAQDKIGYAVSRLSRELRQITEAAGGGPKITTMTASQIVFEKQDATVVDVQLNGSDITMDYSTVSGGPYVLSDGISAFSLTYYQSDGVTAVTDPAQVATVAFVEFALTVVDGGASYDRSTRVALRI